MKRLEIAFGVLRIPGDALAVLCALILAFVLRTLNMDLIPGVQLLEPSPTLPPFDEYLRTFAVPGVIIFVIAAAVLGLYAFRGTQSAWREVSSIAMTGSLWIVLVMAWYFFLRRELFFSRILLVHSTIFITLFVILERSALTIVYRLLLARGIGIRHVVTIGRPPSSATAEALLTDRSYAYLGHIATLRQLQTLVGKQGVDLVIETAPHPDNEDTLALIDACRSQHIEYAFLPPVFADSPHQLRVEHLGLLPLVRFQPTPLDGWGRVLKYLGDMFASALLLILLSPVFGLVALAVFLDSGLPIFYVSKRVGQHGRKDVPVLKFRSMVQDADQRKEELAAMNHRRDGPLFKLKADPRITRVGAVLRRWSLDELPQLFNVFLGQMSMVGPRPHLPDEVKLYEPRERRVFAIKPGITGLAQISGRSDLKFEDEVRLDLQYIEEWSPFLDLWILWRTLFTVIGRKGAD